MVRYYLGDRAARFLKRFVQMQRPGLEPTREGSSGIVEVSRLIDSNEDVQEAQEAIDPSS